MNEQHAIKIAAALAKMKRHGIKRLTEGAEYENQFRTNIRVKMNRARSLANLKQLRQVES